jgi:hypothetical protein
MLFAADGGYEDMAGKMIAAGAPSPRDRKEP